MSPVLTLVRLTTTLLPVAMDVRGDPSHWNTSFLSLTFPGFVFFPLPVLVTDGA